MTQPTLTAAGRAALDVAEEKAPADDFTDADENRNGAVCVRKTADGDLLIKDDNEHTPSQPCPPSYELRSKGQKAIALRKEWLKEDDNKNGVVCVKQIGDEKDEKFVVKDDNENTPSQPCPPAFFPAGAGKQPPVKIPLEVIKEADDNRNGQVCVRVNEETRTVIAKDDNENLPSQPCPPSFAVFGGEKKAEAPIEKT